MSALLGFPNELLVKVAKYLDAKDTSSLLVSHRVFNLVLSSSLHQHALQQEHCITALYLAAANGHELMIRHILAHGAPVVVVGYGAGELQVSSTARLPKAKLDKVVQFLLKKRERSIIVSQARRESPLHQAAEKGREELIKTLLARGASVKQLDAYGWTALMRANNEGHSDVSELLKAHGRPRRSRVQKGGSLPKRKALGRKKKV